MKEQVIAEIKVVPLGTATTSLSEYVAACIDTIKQAEGMSYQLTAMGTNIQGSLERVLELAQKMHEVPFTMGAKRVATTISIDDRWDKLATMDFGDRVKMNICILQDISVEDAKVDGIIKEMKDELIQYSIDVEISWVRLWYRPGFMGKKAFDNVALKPLTPPCDRLFALTSRHAGDFFWSLLLPEYLGMVDALTYTRGYSVAEWVP